ncbi:MAG TPA: hypothetical protein VN622_15495 [Clostridia bacterium]|nr:hypothetical protein [Clostridia bacterium]
MGRNTLIIAVLSSAIAMGGAAYHNALYTVTNNPAVLYIAGQLKMISGDTNAGLNLISRAALAGRKPLAESTPQAQTPVAAASASKCMECSSGPPQANVVPSDSNSILAARKDASKTRMADAVVVEVPDVEVLAAAVSPTVIREDLAQLREVAQVQVDLEPVLRANAVMARLQNANFPDHHMRVYMRHFRGAKIMQ